MLIWYDFLFAKLENITHPHKRPSLSNVVVLPFTVVKSTSFVVKRVVFSVSAKNESVFIE